MFLRKKAHNLFVKPRKITWFPKKVSGNPFKPLFPTEKVEDEQVVEEVTEEVVKPKKSSKPKKTVLDDQVDNEQ